MNETIKTKADFKWSSLPVIFLIGSMVLLLAVYGKFYLHIRLYDISTVLFKVLSIDLWFAGNNTLQQALAEVNGQPIPIVKLGTYISMLDSFLFLFVVNPILFIFSRKKINNNKLEQKKSSLVVRIGYVISVAILIIIPANTITATVVLNSHLDRFKKMSAEQKYQQVDVRSELSKIVFKAQQYYILPVEEGGGGKSFLKNNKSLTLSDLGFEERSSLGRTILYQQKSDTILYLHFFGNRISSRNTSNDPEIIHVVEYKMIIYPSDYKIDMNY